ncbi:hypothetical protein [Halobacterium rubrum]|uniref:hypothetical protein n=1 Tax=Halobacterium TaxID=2239 RepID=UPI001F35448B|nr:MULTISPECIES: hypothetical protein [Halobacterium]MDH5018918.1 hypothetical protein [Halobacterium rubrum]
MRASVAVLANTDWCERIRAATPDQISVESATDPAAFEDTLSGEVAVALVARDYSPERLEAVVASTISASPHARVALLGEPRPADDAVPRDAEFVPPLDREAFGARVEGLYLRAHYAATLERYYGVSVKIRNAELWGDEAVDDDHLDRLKTVQNRSRRYLRQFRAALDEDSLSALKSRSDRLEALVAESKPTPDPDARGLPDSCPACDIDWTTWHGRSLRNGYQKLGANTWQCTNCGETLADPSPSSYQVR